MCDLFFIVNYQKHDFTSPAKQLWTFSKYLSNDKILALLLTFAPAPSKIITTGCTRPRILKEITFIDKRITIIQQLEKVKGFEDEKCKLMF